MLSRNDQLNKLLNTINNIYKNHPDVWDELSREAERLLNKSNHDIKHEFYNRVDPSEVCPYLKSSMPRSALDEIDRTSRNISPVRAATMLIDKIFHYDESFYQFLIALVKSKQGDLVESLLKNVGENKPYLRQYFLPESSIFQHRSLNTPGQRSLHTPPNTQLNSEVQGSEVGISNPNTVDNGLARGGLASQQRTLSGNVSEPRTVDDLARGLGSQQSGDMFSAPMTVDSHLRRQPGNSRDPPPPPPPPPSNFSGRPPPSSSTSQLGAQMSTMNHIDRILAAGGSTTGDMRSAPRPVDGGIKQKLAEKDRQIQQLKQKYQQLERAVVVVHGSMENFVGRVRNNIPHESAEPQAGEFTSADFTTDN